MKKINILSIVLLVLIVFTACEDTNENLVADRGDYAVPEIKNLKPANFTVDLETTFIKFDITLPKGQKADAADIEVVYKNKSAKIKSVSSFPATVTIKAKDVLAKLGVKTTDVKPGDDFEFFIPTTRNGDVTRSKTKLVVSVVCPFKAELIVGNYELFSPADSWDSKGDITLKSDAIDPYTIKVLGLYAVDGGAPNTNEMVMHINPDTYKVTGEKSLLGAVDPFGFNIPGYYYKVVDGSYKPCDGKYELVIEIGLEGIGGALQDGPFKFEFTRK